MEGKEKKAKKEKDLLEKKSNKGHMKGK